MAARLQVRGLTLKIPTTRGWICPVNDVSFALDEGETLGIVGESGSGKTMLALALMGLEPAGARRSGEARLQTRDQGDGLRDLIALSGKQARELRGRDIAMIFQEPMTALNPVLRVGRQIAEAIHVHERKLSGAELNQRVLEALERASVPNPPLRARQYPHQLSGGLRQRVMIAMALAAGPGVLIADEPTTALDVTVQRQILQLLARLREQMRLSMLFITHDLGVIAQVADRVLVMYAGRVVEEGPVGAVLRRPRHPYTAGLLRAAPRLKRERPEPIPGIVPPLDCLPPGCSFAPRCPHAMPQCEAALPDLGPVGGEADPEQRARCVLATRELAMTGAGNREQQQRIREQFTKTAEVFGRFAVATRGGEAEWLMKAVGASKGDRVIDVACGPGTMTLPFARQVGWICGLDLTPAILERAKKSARDAGLTNLSVAIGDAGHLPFADGALDLAITSYSLHHMPDAARVIGELARLVRTGGRVGVVDIRVQEDPAIETLNTRIERLRDASHTRTLRRSEFDAIFAANRLRIVAVEIHEQARQFDHWLHVAGLRPGDARYQETRKLMESTLENDGAGFHPRYEPAKPGAEPELMITNTVLLIAGEKE